MGRSMIAELEYDTVLGSAMEVKMRPSRMRVLSIVRRLYEEYGAPRLGNKSDPVAELVFISLSRQTHEKNYTRTWRALRRAYRTWDRVCEASAEEMYDVIRDGGFARQKVAWVQAMLRMIQEQFGRLSLKELRRLPDDKLSAT